MESSKTKHQSPLSCLTSQNLDFSTAPNTRPDVQTKLIELRQIIKIFEHSMKFKGFQNTDYGIFVLNF